MKAILMSIRPEWVVKILNGKKTIEIRKRFPKDYVGWVYIYCTKDHNNLLHKNCAGIWWVEDKDFQKKNKRLGIEQQPIYNGKIVARFWCDKVEEISKIIMYNRPFDLFETETLQPTELLKQSCLRATEMTKYFMFSNLPKESAAIHVAKVKPFDKPKEISEFWNNGKKVKGHDGTYQYSKLTSAPQSWCYVEV